MTEKQLIKRCCQHDRTAQQKLYEKYAPQMLGVCRRYVSDWDVAQDLMHDAFITVFSKIGDFRGEGSFEGWMRRIFVNTALGYVRKQKNWQNSVPMDSLSGQLEADTVSALEKMEARELMRCIEAMPEGYRVVLNLFAIEGYSHKEIAEMLEINEGTSRSQYARAKLYLQKMLKKQEGF